MLNAVRFVHGRPTLQIQKWKEMDWLKADNHLFCEIFIQAFCFNYPLEVWCEAVGKQFDNY